MRCKCGCPTDKLDVSDANRKRRLKYCEACLERFGWFKYWSRDNYSTSGAPKCEDCGRKLIWHDKQAEIIYALDCCPSCTVDRAESPELPTSCTFCGVSGDKRGMRKSRVAGQYICRSCATPLTLADITPKIPRPVISVSEPIQGHRLCVDCGRTFRPWGAKPFVRCIECRDKRHKPKAKRRKVRK